MTERGERAAESRVGPSGDLAVRVSHSDARPTAVLVHGALDRGGSFRAAIPFLDDVRVVTYDRRGYGRSAAGRPLAQMSDHADDLLDIVRAQPEPCVVVAHSFGGVPAMLAATVAPGAFAALGLYETALSWLEWWPQSTRDYVREVASSTDPGELAEQLARSILGDQGWAALSEEGRAQRRAEGRAFQIDTASQLHAPFDFDDVAAPVLVGYGTESFDDRKVGGPWLAERLPDARLHVIDGADHWAQRSSPELFAEFVRAVIARAGTTV